MNRRAMDKQNRWASSGRARSAMQRRSKRAATKQTKRERLDGPIRARDLYRAVFILAATALLIFNIWMAATGRAGWLTG